ncbi:hypothetical protein [Sphingobium sp. B1D7B]|uniref:hypothetical protein n=1 Tax=Sphingobium sp. B1D7B TaxID=2940578 RepID=UPI0022248096|nr:hypothetical protein [Sphingobium sp. B1D7B]
MSRKEKIVSSEEQGGVEPDSVFDFLYHDSRRIASFLSQFDDNGLLTGLTQGDTVSKGAKRSKRVGLGGDVALLGGGKLEFEVGPGEVGTQTLERVYDPFWANARFFLDVLVERNMIQRGLATAEIGQFVLVKGWLTVLDLAMFKEAWKLPSLQRKIREGAAPKTKGSMTAAQREAVKEQKDNANLMLEMMQIMPHSVHASLLTSGEDRTAMVWCTLKEDYLVTPASDLTLAHGDTLPGEWAMVGVLSARPEYTTIDTDNLQFDDDLPGMMQSVVGKASKTIAPIVRLALGRPRAAHAITPLLIFREVS